jgi:kynurenine formamidase
MHAIIAGRTVNLNAPISLAQALYPQSGPFRGAEPGTSAFGAPPFSAEPVRAGDFVGATAEGGPLNFLNLALNPHGNGTHTECVGHISKEPMALHACLQQYHAWAWVITVEPNVQANGDWLITHAAIREALDALGAPGSGSPEAAMPLALVLRTGPAAERRGRQWTGNNPPYLEAAALESLAEEGWLHLLLDLPSVDREEDGGLLSAHHAWWQYPGTLDRPVRKAASITELIVVPDDLADGLYWLNLQIAPLMTDASPSNPVLYPLV